MTDHVKSPRLCRACVECAHALAAKADGPTHQFCAEHRVLALLQVRAGRIVSWLVAGPVTDQQRDAMVADFKSAGRSRASTRAVPASPMRCASIGMPTYNVRL